MSKCRKIATSTHKREPPQARGLFVHRHFEHGTGRVNNPSLKQGSVRGLVGLFVCGS